MGEPAGRASRSEHRTVLVTGASAGIGEALARSFARDGCALVLVARDVRRLKALAAALRSEHGVEVRVQPADLTDPHAASRIAAALARARIEVDVLVNNAGVLHQGRFDAMPPGHLQQMIGLNVAGLTAMLAHFVPPMVVRGRGRVLNVASVAAFQPVPGLATYAATKAYVLSLTESLAEELAGTGVTVTALCPGITATGMLTAATQANERLTQLPSFLVGDVDDVARQGHEACLRGEVVRVPGVLNLAGTLASRAAPRWLVRRVAGAFGRRTL